MQERVEADLKTAMKAGERERVSTLRLLLSELKNERIKLGEDLDEAAAMGVVQRAIKQRRDAAEQYRAGDREDRAAAEESEAEILGGYLPAQVGEDELRTAIAACLDELGLEGPRAMGPLMKQMLERFAGRTDGGTVSRIAREVIASRDG